MPLLVAVHVDREQVAGAEEGINRAAVGDRRGARHAALVGMKSGWRGTPPADVPENRPVVARDTEQVKLVGSLSFRGRQEDLVLPDDRAGDTHAGQRRFPLDIFFRGPLERYSGCRVNAVAIDTTPLRPFLPVPLW